MSEDTRRRLEGDMSELRHKGLYNLANDIERCLRKISEGLNLFDAICKKIRIAQSANQKSKHETDLKKEIKKLQRQREQLKVWITSTEIQETGVLIEGKKMIEMQMIKFKVMEREMKRKAFSREGFVVPAFNPITLEREELDTWIVASLNQIQLQLDQYESELESLALVKKRKCDREKYNREEELKVFIGRHKFHLKNLEKCLRTLDNLCGDTSTLRTANEELHIKNFMEKLRDVREDVDYYICANQEPQFQDNLYIYDDVDSFHTLVEQEQWLMPGEKAESDNCVVSDMAQAEQSLDTDSTNAAQEEESDQPNSSNDNENLESARKFCADTVQGIENDMMENEDSTSVASSLETSDTHGEYNLASSGCTQKLTAKGVVSESIAELKEVLSSHPQSDIPRESHQLPSHKITKSSTLFGVTPADVLKGKDVGAPTWNTETQGFNPQANPSPGKGVSGSLPTYMDSSNSQRVNQPPLPMSSFNQFLNRSEVTFRLPAGLSKDMVQHLTFSELAQLAQRELHKLPNGVMLEKQPDTHEAYIPPGLGICPLGYVELQPYHLEQQRMLEVSYNNMPTRGDSVPNKAFLMQQPCPTPSYYPQTPLTITNPFKFFQKYSVDTLIFIFYYAEATKAQFFAAKVLKMQHWRFHTKYFTWFQRYQEPIAITSEYEHGVYSYFDIGTWRQNVKDDFTFHYKYLEDKIF